MATELPGRRTITEQDAKLVHTLIKNCLKEEMTKDEVVDVAFRLLSIPRVVTSRIWDELKKKNEIFFDLYGTRVSSKVLFGNAGIAARVLYGPSSSRALEWLGPIDAIGVNFDDLEVYPLEIACEAPDADVHVPAPALANDVNDVRTRWFVVLVSAIIVLLVVKFLPVLPMALILFSCLGAYSITGLIEAFNRILDIIIGARDSVLERFDLLREDFLAALHRWEAAGYPLRLTRYL